MDDRKPPDGVASAFLRKEPRRSGENPEERTKRLEREREMIEEARESIRAGLYIPDHEVDAWLDRLVNDEPLPIPGSRLRLALSPEPYFFASTSTSRSWPLSTLNSRV